ATVNEITAKRFSSTYSEMATQPSRKEWSTMGHAKPIRRRKRFRWDASRPQRAGFPLTTGLPRACLPRLSWVKISQVRTISVERIGKRLGKVDPEDLAQVVDGLLELIS